VLLRLPQLSADGQRLLYLRKVNPYVFEEMILTALERRGIPVRRNNRYSGDGGLDGQFWVGSQRWVVQASAFQAQSGLNMFATLGNWRVGKNAKVVHPHWTHRSDQY
jgi:hypothetical protein